MKKVNSDIILEMLAEQDKRIRELEKDIGTFRKSFSFLLKLVNLVGVITGLFYYATRFMVKGRGKGQLRGRKK